MKPFPLLSIPLATGTLAEALAEVQARAMHTQGGTVAFVNVHTATEAQEYPPLLKALTSATFAFPDGMPLVWVARSRGVQTERICGPDFMAEFSKRNPNLRVGLIGSTEAVCETLAQKLGIQAQIYCPPYRPFSTENAREDWANFLKRCPNEEAPALVWVGLGAPKQELWMTELWKIAPKTIFLGVGAAFDFHSGMIQRAPRWMQRFGLEWAYRLTQDPKRLWRRYWVTNVRFLQLIVRDTNLN